MQLLHAGLDIGSTTAKVVVLDEYDRIIFSRYSRHFADIRAAVSKLVNEMRDRFSGSRFTLAMAGSGALELAQGMDVPFTQEQIACTASIARFLPGVDVCIELGGEDAKITFFDPAGAEQRMNETCAGGTGAFLDQMATLFGTDAAGLNEMAKGYKTIYPVASRCGVFAKTDVQALLNDGASKPDIAASIFQAIVNQTISGLACGRRIQGRVAFLGGPLYFLSELRKRFSETLKLPPEQCIFPENPHLFVAMGAAISAKQYGAVAADVLQKRAEHFFISHKEEKHSILPPLFGSEAELDSFKERHSKCAAKRVDIASYKGDAYLGIDVGSTTTKVVLIGSQGELLFSRYKINGVGEPVKTVREVLSELYSLMPETVTIKSSGVTGYGEKLIQAAFGIDVGEVETVAHARAAGFVLPGADFVIDIGGQDMKCLRIKDGVIDGVFLNEACSSGCGSFLQSFAKSLNMEMDEFARAAEQSRNPVDLGSRCTVFMNSRVRQAQKEGAAIEDISAGLVYSVVRNALYKVLKIKDPSELGEKIVVQGGTFKNNALLRAFELVTKRDVVRPDISELMGAFGAALISRDNAPEKSALLGREEIADFKAESTTRHCAGCGNKCLLTLTKFGDGKTYISGNRCERGASVSEKGALPANIFAKKYRRLFDHYKPLAEAEAPRGVMGVPRVLNMYEDYPFWFTILTKLGFSVRLSSKAPDENLGIDTIPSQTVCYPAKLVHRHITELLENGVKNIFYPVMLRETKEFAGAQKNYNCPVVTGYPDVARLNIDRIREEGVNYIKPELFIESDRSVAIALKSSLAQFGVTDGEIKAAIAAAREEMARYKRDIEQFGAGRAARAQAARRRRHSPRGTPLPPEPRGQPRNTRAHQQLRRDALHGRLRLLDGEGHRKARRRRRGRPVGLPFAPLPRGHGRRVAPRLPGRRARAVQLLRLRPRRDKHGADGRHPDARRKALHTDKNRRRQKQRRGQDTHTLAARRDKNAQKQPRGRQRRAAYGNRPPERHRDEGPRAPLPAALELPLPVPRRGLRKRRHPASTSCPRARARPSSSACATSTTTSATPR